MSTFKRVTAIGAGMACVAALTVSVGLGAAGAATTTNLTVRPSSAVFDANNTVGVPGDAAPGFNSGSMASNGVAKTDMYFTPQALFGHDVTVGDVASMSYLTKTGAMHTVDPRDWFMAIYTKPYAGDVSTPLWYGDRIGTEPYFSSNLNDPANTWNQWSTGSAQNQLRFFESTDGAPGATFGSYTDPNWSTFTSGNSLSGTPFAGHGVLYFSLQTGSAWAAGFTGSLDGLRIQLTNGDIATVNFEADVACTTVCYVDAVNGNNAYGGDTPATAKKTIQAALNQVSSGGQVRVLPGVYNESAPGSNPTTIAGTYQFGLFFPSSKPGITLMGVTSGDVPVTNAAAPLARINTDATNNFGTDGIFVEAANTTIQGVEIGPNASGDNKTIEVVANNFTLRNSNTDIPGGGGSIYIDDFSTAGNIVQSYTLQGNIFDDGTSIDLSSGAGAYGPVSGRQITGNTFGLVGGDFNAISFNGSNTGVPWFVNTVGGAVIQNNTFSGGSTQYIRARGTYDNSQFDWSSYWNTNTFDKAAIALVTQSPFVVRSYSYTSGSYTFNDVRRIGATIQGEIDNAQNNDTVLVKAGTYLEDVLANKAGLKLMGAGIGNSTIVGPMGNAAGDTVQIPASAPGVTVDGFTITRQGNNTGDWAGPLNNQGVAIYGSGSTLQNSKVTGNRNGVFLYGAINVSIKNNTIDSNRTGMHLVNDVTGLVARNNFITNNWTMGILFRDENSPNPTGAVTIRDNNISGNWYSQVEARSLFSAPALDVTHNWLGTTSPTVVAGPATVGASGSGEPGYTAQIPVAYGGSSVPPASSPTIVYNGLNATNPVSYIPFQCSGTDTSAAIGFQPSGAVTVNGVCFTTFNGFFQPVDNNNLNLAKAGQTIPVKWQLLNAGSPVSDPGTFVSLTSRRISCSTLADVPLDAIETYTSSSGLQYLGSGNWQFNWKTLKGYAGTCRTMTVTLSDGSVHEADFQFK